MRKKVLAMLIVFLFALAIPAAATSPAKAPQLTASLSFSGTTATCTTTVKGDNSSDSIVVTMKLWKNGTAIKTWPASGTYVVRLNKTATVIRGQTYKLTVDATINGVAQPQQSVTRTCP